VDHPVNAGDAARIAPGADEALVGCQQVGDVAGHPDVRGRQDDQVVADALDARDVVR